jgi:hypothetical protein
MIITTHSDREFEDTLALLAVINELRERGPGYFAPVIQDTPWVRTVWARPQYL